MSTFFVYVWFISLIVFIVYWRKKVNAKRVYGPNSMEYKSIKNTKTLIGVVCLISFLAIGAFESPNDSKVKSQAEKSVGLNSQQIKEAAEKEEKRNLASENYKMKSKKAIEDKTGSYVTDFSIMEYSEYKQQDGKIQTSGEIKLDSNKEKHKFWATFQGNRLVRLKIDADVIFME